MADTILDTEASRLNPGALAKARELLASEFDAEGVSRLWGSDIRAKPLAELCWSERAAIRALCKAIEMGAS